MKTGFEGRFSNKLSRLEFIFDLSTIISAGGNLTTSIFISLI